MVSSSGRYVATYNGEIYNFVELRDELQSYGRMFRGQIRHGSSPRGGRTLGI